MNISEIRKIELDILNDVASFCERNGLKYTLFYGTLLGAVRHKGFIPWDDDIDIAMPRRDYEIFLRTFSSEKYVSIDCISNQGYIYPFAKVYDPSFMIKENARFDCNIGIYVDIFPIDFIDKGKMPTFQKKIWNLRKTWSRAIDPKNETSNSPIRRLFSLIYNRQRTNLLAAKMEKLAKQYSSNTGFAISYLDCRKDCYTSFGEGLFDSQKMIFESHMFCCPKDCNAVLHKLYGNYMELPPMEKRVFTHNFVIRSES